MTQPIHADLPPQLRELSVKSQDLFIPVRDTLQAKLLVAPSNATPERVLADTFAQLGYLPVEAKLAALKILGCKPD